MSTQNFPLQPLNEGHGKANTDPGYLQEPLEASTKAGTKVQCWKDWPWKRILTTVTNLLGYVSLYTGISMIAPFYPIVAASKGVPVYIAGFVMGTAPLCVTVMSPIIGYFLPHFGLKFTQLAGLFLAGGSLILFGFLSMMPTPATFIVFSFLLRTVEGIGTAMFNTASYTLLTHLYAKNKGMIVGIIELSLTFGYLLGAPIGGGLQEAGGFMLPFVVVGGCIVVLMLILVVLGHSTDCTSKTLSWRLLLRLLTNIIIVIVVLSMIVTNSAVMSLLSYFGRFLNDQFNLKVGIIGAVYLSGTVLYALGTFVAGPLTDKLVPRYLIIAGLMVGVVSFALIGPAPFITTPKLWLTILAFSISGAVTPFAIVPIYADVYSTAVRHHKAEDEEAIASTLSGIVVASYSAGGWVGPIVGGALMQKVGFQSMTSIFSLLLLANRPQIPETCEPHLVEMMKQCWQDDPKARPTFEEILRILDQ